MAGKAGWRINTERVHWKEVTSHNTARSWRVLQVAAPHLVALCNTDGCFVS